ncbi:MAG: hypothetical protein ACK4GJ_00760 [bacterium]
MLKSLPLKLFSLTRDINNSNYNILELFVLIENLSKYKYSGYIEVKDSKQSFIILIDEGVVVSYVDVTDEPTEISPLIFKYRIEEEMKAVVYVLPPGFSTILRGFHFFENQVMNYVVNNTKDWESLLTKLIKKNITGILELNFQIESFQMLVKSGNLFLRPDIVNNNNLIISSFYYNEVILERIKNNSKFIVNVLGIDNKELEEKLKENDFKHSLVKEMEIRESKGIFGGNITISTEIIEFWYSSLGTNSFLLKIEGLEGNISAQIRRDPKLPADVIEIPPNIIQKIKIRNRKALPGEKIAVYPEIK